jgi:hypothetical protein
LEVKTEEEKMNKVSYLLESVYNNTYQSSRLSNGRILHIKRCGATVASLLAVALNGDNKASIIDVIVKKTSAIINQATKPSEPLDDPKTFWEG